MLFARVGADEPDCVSFTQAASDPNQTTRDDLVGEVLGGERPSCNTGTRDWDEATDVEV